MGRDSAWGQPLEAHVRYGGNSALPVAPLRDAAGLLVLFSRHLHGLSEGREFANTRRYLRALTEGAEESVRKTADALLATGTDPLEADDSSLRFGALQQIVASFLYFEAGLALCEDEESPWTISVRETCRTAGAFFSLVAERFSRPAVGMADDVFVDEALLEAEQQLRALARVAVSGASTPQLAAQRLSQRDRLAEGLSRLREAHRELERRFRPN